MDFSETDIWWLIDRKNRENKAKGKTFFFTPYKGSLNGNSKDNSNFCKYNLLKTFGVKIENCTEFNDFIVNGCVCYEKYYEIAIDRMKEIINNSY